MELVQEIHTQCLIPPGYASLETRRELIKQTASSAAVTGLRHFVRNDRFCDGIALYRAFLRTPLHQWYR